MATWTFGSFGFIANQAIPRSFQVRGGFKLAQEDIPRKAGSAIQTAPKLGSLNLSLEGILHATTAAAFKTARDALTKEIAGGRAAFYADRADRYIMATCLDFQLARSSDRGGELVADFLLTFSADDPFWESTTLDSSPYTTNALDQVIAAGGDADSPPTITVTAPAGGLTRFDVNNDTTGKTFRWDGTLTVGQTLIINMEAKTITENGVQTWAGLHSSAAFWALQTGNNTVDLTSTPTGASLTLTKRARWYPG